MESKPDSYIAQAAKTRREVFERLPTPCPPGYADGIEPQFTARPKGRHLEAMGLQSPPAPRLKRDSARNKPAAQEINPVMAAVIYLGAKEKDDAYWLDGQPVSAKALVQRLNAARTSHGLEPIGPEAWR